MNFAFLQLLSVRFKLWFFGFIVVRQFYSAEEVIDVRERTKRVVWQRGESGFPHGSYVHSISALDKEFEDDKFIKLDKLKKSEEILSTVIGVGLTDVGTRTLQLRLHSPKWHIDCQTFDQHYPFVARSRNFRVYKCGVYLQKSNDGSGGIELKTPFLGGGIKNLCFISSKRFVGASIRVPTFLRKVFRFLCLVSDSIQVYKVRPNLGPGDLVIFDGGVRHRASQPRHSSSIIKDTETGFFIDRQDVDGKIMLQWEFTSKNNFGDAYVAYENDVKFKR